MSNMLEKYKDVADELPVPIDDNEVVEMSSSKAERLNYYKKRELRVLKRLTKALRKQNKLLKMEAERRKAEEEAAVTAEKDKCDTRKKGFLKNLGDAICKAIPKVLTTLVTLAFGYFFQREVSPESSASRLRPGMMQMAQHAPAQPSPFAWCLLNESGTPISTFAPSVVEVIKIVNGSNVEREDARLRLRFMDGSITETTVCLSNLDRVEWFEIDHRCIVNPEYRQARKFIANAIRAGISNAPVETRYILDRTGLHHINNSIIFAAGDRVISRSSAPETNPNFELGQLPFHLDIDESISPSEAIDGMLELIGLSREIGPVLVAHVISGIIRAAFKNAGLTPCAILVIVGKSGMLKSHYVPHLAQLYNRADGIGPVTRFNSTKRFIEEALYEYSECTAVIDDLHTAESGSIKRRNEETAEEIIRRIADDTGRGRMDGKSQVQQHFRGNAVFIGEYTIGKASTIPRALVVDLTKPPNGAILDKYQRQSPLIVSTFYYHFIQWYVDHFDEIRDGIDAELTKLRKASALSATHGRLRDTQFYLQTSYKLFCEFCKDAGYCSEKDARDTYNAFSVQINELVQAQQARFKESVEVEEINYLALIRGIYKNGSLHIAKTPKGFDPDKHDGLIYYDCLCLRGKSLEREIRRIEPHSSLDECVSALLNKGALKLVGSKNTVQVNGTGGKRFYALKLNKLR